MNQKSEKRALVDAAMHLRRNADAQSLNVRLCLQQAEALRLILSDRGIASKVCVGGIRLRLGADSVSPIELVYEPEKFDHEWHAWLRVGNWIVDASIADLHRQMIETGQADARTYRPRSPFTSDVIVTKPFALGKSKYRAFPSLEPMYYEMLESPGDMLVVNQLSGG